MQSFLICPVRNADPALSESVVSELERRGWVVHWPHRDTNQDDPIGLNICSENLNAMTASDVVHFIWDGKSQGCLFDLGMAFALGKRVVPVEMPPRTDGKSFQNMVEAWAVVNYFEG